MKNNSADNSDNKIGMRIRQQRRLAGVTQEELGKAAEVSKATINKYETGVVKNIKRSTVEKIAKHLDISPSYLMGWTDSVNVETNNGVIGQNSGTIMINDASRSLSKEELELLRIYNKLDIKGRIALLQKAMELEEVAL